MRWWDEVLNLLRDEFATEPQLTAEPASAKQAEALLKRTSREITTAKARAEAARRRLLRAQDQMLALTQPGELQNGYRERLTDLAKAIANESDLVQAFDAHIQRLSEVQARIEHEATKFERDLQMARTAHVAAATTQRVNPDQKPMPADVPAGFRRSRSQHVIDGLKTVPKSETGKPKLNKVHGKK
jgi:glycerol-3-phosphate dehydrogenase